MSNKGSERQHSCLAPDPRGESIQSFAMKYDVRIFVDVLYQIEEVPLCS